MLRTLARRRIGRIRHVKWPTPKHIENSLRGIAYAARHRYDAIDIDMQITADGVIVATHWARPMVRDGFHDPEHKIPRFTPVRRMTWAQVHRLVAPKKYHIQRIERILRSCARRGITALLEPKGDPRFDHDEPWIHIFAVAQDVGATVSVRALPENAGALVAARRAAANAGEHVEAWGI